MRILVLSFYYQPDLGAGSFRTTALVRALREQAPRDTRIDVVTTLPNRYHTFNLEAPQLEEEGGFEIRRIAMSRHRSDMLGQSRAFLHFAAGALRATAGRSYDVVFATSSRLMTAALGSWIARRKHAALYLDVRDLFVDSISDLLRSRWHGPMRGVLSAIESWTMRRADRINLVSAGFSDYFRKRYPSIPIVCFTNGIDEEFLVPSPPPATSRELGSPAVVLYAGNIGEGQGLHEIVPGLATALRGRVRFVVIGDGGRRRELERSIAGVDNVELRAPVPRTELLEAYRAADVLFLHLGDYPALEKVLPSKVFEYAAIGKPMLAGVAGFAADFIRDEVNNAAVFPPCHVAAGVAAFEALRLADSPRPEFIAKYSRVNIVRSMAEDVLGVRRRRR